MKFINLITFAALTIFNVIGLKQAEAKTILFHEQDADFTLQEIAESTLSQTLDHQIKTENKIYLKGEWPTEIKSTLIPSLVGVGRLIGSDEEATAFTDNTFKSFDFIDNSLNKQQLVEAIIQLKKLAQNKDEQAANANYLLGNFYYNTSHFGYYRNLFYYEAGNYYLSYIYGYNTIPNTIKRAYNYNDGAGLISYNNPQKPYDYFLTAESISANNELKAKAVFQASKCELDLFFAKQNNSFYGYEGNYSLLYSSSTRPMFARLKNNYSQTAYYKDIVSNCKYFRFYLGK